MPHLLLSSSVSCPS